MEYKVLLCCLKKGFLKAFIGTYLIGNMQSLGREEPTKVSMWTKSYIDKSMI
jgi:hypothetical protein